MRSSLRRVSAVPMLVCGTTSAPSARRPMSLRLISGSSASTLIWTPALAAAFETGHLVLDQRDPEAVREQHQMPDAAGAAHRFDHLKIGLELACSRITRHRCRAPGLAGDVAGTLILRDDRFNHRA